MPNKTLTWRVKQLETNYKSLDKKVDAILTNHLPTLQKEVVSLGTEVKSLKSYIVGATVFNVAAIIISKFLL